MGVNYEFMWPIVVLTFLIILSLVEGTYGFAVLIALLDCFYLIRFVNGIHYYVIQGDEFCIEGLFGKNSCVVLFDDMVKIHHFRLARSWIARRGFPNGRNPDGYEGSTLKIQMKSGQILEIDMTEVRDYNELGEALKEKLGDRFE
jgi:hypothetical protein